MLSGRLDTLSVLEVLQLLQRSSSTGVLRVSGPDKAVIYCTDGAVTLAASTAADVAHQVLIQPGLVETEEWQAAAADGHALGDLLATRGVGEERYLHYLRHSIEEAVFELSLWQEGEFAFAAGETHPLANVIGYPVDDLLAAVGQRAQAWEALLGRIPGLDAVAEPVPFLPGEQDSITVTRSQFRVLSVLDGSQSVIAISRLLSDGVFNTSEVLADLVDAGLARFRGAPAATPRPAKKARAKAPSKGAAAKAGPAASAEAGNGARPQAGSAPAIAPMAGIDVASPNETPDRSLVLRLLSAVKELEVSEGGAG